MQLVKDNVKKVVTHPFSRDVAILQTSSVINTGIAFLTSLIFARLLGPEQFGFYSLVFALAGFINIFQEVGIGQGTINLLARANAKKDLAESREILASFVRISLLVLLIVGTLGVIAAPIIGKYIYKDLELGRLAAIIVATFALTLFLPLTTITLQVVRRIRGLAILEVVNKTFVSGLPIALVLLGLGVLGIVQGQFLAMIIMSVVGFLVFKKVASQEALIPDLREFFWKKIDNEKLSEYFRFGFTIAINKNLLKLVSSIPLLILGFFLATKSGLGFYKVAFAYMSLPVVLLGPVSRLLNIQFPKTELGGTEKLLRRFFQVSALGFLAALLLTMILLVLGPYLIDLFYGLDYAPSKAMIYPLALYPLFVSIGVGLGPLFRTLNKMRVAIYINIVSVILIIPTAYFLIGNFSIRGLIVTVLIFSLFPTALSFIYFIRMYRRATND